MKKILFTGLALTIFLVSFGQTDSVTLKVPGTTAKSFQWYLNQAIANATHTHDYADITGKPTLATVATSGSYVDLTNKPSLFSGSYTDLTNKPSLFSGSYTDLTNKPALATVATSGSYNDLTNRPTISGTNTGDVTTNAIGYATGAGGTVTQATSKSTGVTLSKLSGQITMTNSALAANTNVTFTLTNTNIANTDVLILNHASGGTAGAYNLNAQCGNGSATINVRNVTAGSLSEAIVIRFVLIKAVTN